MNQNNIGDLIRKLRLKSNLTQAQFADKYIVSPQAVSKWEKNLNLPDVSIIKQICKDYNISFEEMMNGKLVSQKKKNNKLIIIFCIILLIVVITLVIFINKSNHFEFKTISSNCDNFTISGSMAYSSTNSHLYLSNVDYCGGNDNNFYKRVECTLYEKDGNNIKMLGQSNYNGNELIKLENFLEKLAFNLNDFSKVCHNYKDDSLYLEIKGIKKDDSVIIYNIPLSINKACLN